jgi:glyoxylase-like metal-dependent hydrolase (beta-lactamase superfamily II)
MGDVATAPNGKSQTGLADGAGLSRRGILGSAAALAAAPLLSGIPALLVPSQARATGAPLGAKQPTWCRFKLGSFELTMASDSDAFIPGPFPIVGGNASQGEVEQLMRDNLLPPDKYQPGFTPMIVNTGKQLVIFDTGNGAKGFVPRPAGGWLATQLADSGITPEQIDVVVLSHGHPDHVGGVMENGKPLFPNARYVIGATEYDFWAPEGKFTGEAEKLASLFRANVVPLADKITFLKPGDDVVPGIRSREAYGHTPGHLAFDIESEGKRMLFWGDCAHHQVASLARPEWHCSFDVDKEQGAKTRRRIYELAAAERVPVSGYHMPFPSIGYVERLDGGGYRWLAHTYQLNLP